MTKKFVIVRVMPDHSIVTLNKPQSEVETREDYLHLLSSLDPIAAQYFTMIEFLGD